MCVFFSLLSSQDIKAIYSSQPCYKSLDELFPPTTTVFMVGNPYYGAMGEVCHQLPSQGHQVSWRGLTAGKYLHTRRTDVKFEQKGRQLFICS